MQIDWLGYTLDGIVSGKTADGVRLLELFLNDYKAKFNVNTVCGTCPNKLKDYYRKLTQSKKSNTMESQFRLKAKYQNIPLRNTGEGYNVNVNNGNLTDEKAIILLERYAVEKVFDVFPDAETIEALKKQYSTPVVEELETVSEEIASNEPAETSETEIETDDNQTTPEEPKAKRGRQPKN